MRSRYQRAKPWLTWAGAIMAAAVVLPPGATAARHYVFAQALQFAVLAVVVPALVVLGAPWRMAGTRFADRAAIARSHRRATWRAWACLVTFLVVAIAWRLPLAVNALARHPALLVGEALTLVVAGCALWLELVESPPLLPTIPRPPRAALAAVSMWTIWAIAYIMGFSGTTWYSAYAHVPGHGLGIVADQEIAVALLWAITGLAFVPVIYVCLLSWLRDSSDPDNELAELADGGGGSQPGAPRPPRGWRLPPA